MSTLEAIGYTTLALTLSLPMYWAGKILFFLIRPGHRQDESLEATPSVAVILAVRGADPSLSRCLSGLLEQNYPNYCVRIVIDSAEDAGWTLIEKTLAAYPERTVDVRVEKLTTRRNTCSLKVSAELQAIASLDPDVEIVALIDADSIPAPDWLGAMVQPFSDPQVGASTGIRWFAPQDDQWGTIVRYVFNAASLPQMYEFNIAWGGSLAIRRSVFETTDLLEIWSRSFCEDTGIHSAIHRNGLRVAFAPRATQINAESIDLRSCYNFLLRQLLCVRLHLVDWPYLFAANLANTLALIALAALLVWNVYAQKWEGVFLSCGLLGLYFSGSIAALNLLETRIRKIAPVQALGSPRPAFSWKTILALLLTQVLASFIMIVAIFARRVVWRGITYHINGPENIRLVAYRRFQPTTDSLSSIV